MLRTIPTKEDPNLAVTYGSSFGFTMLMISQDPPPVVERITHSAIRVSREMIAVVPAPGRHHHIINTLGEAGVLSPELLGLAEQGFMTTDSRFVSREVGLLIAKTARQILRKTPPENQLFSEDLW